MTGAVSMMGSGGGAIVAGGTYAGAAVGFNSDGTVTSLSGSAFWFFAPSSGIGANYWVRATKTSGPASFSPAAGTWQPLAAGVTYSAVSGVGACNGTVDFATDAAGATIVASGTLSVNNTL